MSWWLRVLALLTAAAIWVLMGRAYQSADVGWPPTEPAPWSQP